MSIELEHVSYIYNRGTPAEWQALRDVSLTIRPGEFVGLIGATGSGKSTLVQHMNGLLRPTSGRVRVFGMDTSDRRTDLTRVRQRVGLVFQYPEHQLFAATVAEELAYGPTNLGLPPAEVQRRVRWALRAVGLGEELLTRSPFSLSGGQARRVALAGVLAMRPDVLVLDEPAAGLDPLGRREILDLIRNLHREGMTIVLVSHSMEDVAELATRVVVLDQGRVVMDGPPRVLFRRHRELAALGLAAPVAAELVDALKARGWPVPGQAVTIREAVAEVTAALAARRQAGRQGGGPEGQRQGCPEGGGPEGPRHGCQEGGREGGRAGV